jgi:DNA-binding NarL/FixJ family response regulator
MTDCAPILVVDDDAGFRELVSNLLVGAGHTVAEADSGEAALLAVGDRPPALVILDVCLPGFSGYEICRRLRARFGERLPIIFVSGTRTEPFDRAGGLLIGADDYIVKPFFPDELIARVERLLWRSHADSNGAAGTDPVPGLTEREQQVLRLLAQGLTQAAICAELHISGKTVATHVQRILAKLDVHSRAEAVAFAYRHGLVEVELPLPAGAGYVLNG